MIFRNGYDEHHLEAIEEHKDQAIIDQAIIDPTNIADLGHHDDLGVARQVSYHGIVSPASSPSAAEAVLQQLALEPCLIPFCCRGRSAAACICSRSD